jgi:hypothetical protein
MSNPENTSYIQGATCRRDSLGKKVIPKNVESESDFNNGWWAENEAIKLERRKSERATFTASIPPLNSTVIAVFKETKLAVKIVYIGSGGQYVVAERISEYPEINGTPMVLGTPDNFCTFEVKNVESDMAL